MPDFSPSLLNLYRENGVLYGLPAYSNPITIEYNADLLAQQGLQVPSYEWTFNELLELSAKVASKDNITPIYGMLMREDMFANWRGVEWLDSTSEPPVVKFDTPEMINYFLWLKDLEQEKFFSGLV